MDQSYVYKDAKSTALKKIDMKRSPKITSSIDYLREHLWYLGQPKNPCEPANGIEAVQGKKNDEKPKKQPELTAAEISCIKNLRIEPIPCPVTGCGKFVCTTSMFTHFADVHASTHDVPQAYQGKCTEILMNMSNLEYRRVICLGQLGYTGKTPESVKDVSLQPAKTGICMRNTIFIPSMSHLMFTLPIIVMCKKIGWADLAPPKNISGPLCGHNGDKEMLFIWVCSPPTTKPIYCSLTVFNNARSISRSAQIKVRSLTAPTMPWELLQEADECLFLNDLDGFKQSGNNTNFQHVEVVVYDHN